MRHGQMAVKMITIQILRSYKLSTNLTLKELECRMNVTIHLLNKHLVKIQKREPY